MLIYQLNYQQLNELVDIHEHKPGSSSKPWETAKFVVTHQDGGATCVYTRTICHLAESNITENCEVTALE